MYVNTKCETHISAIIGHACLHASHSCMRARVCLLKSIYGVQCEWGLFSFFSICSLYICYAYYWALTNLLSSFACIMMSRWTTLIAKFNYKCPMDEFVCVLTQRFRRRTCLSNNNNDKNHKNNDCSNNKSHIETEKMKYRHEKWKEHMMIYVYMFLLNISSFSMRIQHTCISHVWLMFLKAIIIGGFVDR